MTKILCDTHIYFWWVTGSQKLPLATRKAIEDRTNDVFVSPVVAWELATKGRLGNWSSAALVLDEMENVVEAKGLSVLPIAISHARLAGSYSARHRDPFDRLLAAQAEAEHLLLATVDPVFREFNVDLL